MIPILLASDENYFFPLLVTIKSLFSTTKEQIDVKILVDKPFSKEKIEILTNLSRQFDNIIDFYDMSNISHTLKCSIPHITVATYYRLWATDIFKEYNKCIYLDVDIVVTGDINELFSIDIGDNYIAGVKAPKFHLHKNGYKSHCLRLGIKDISQYINAGVIVMNLEQIRKNKIDVTFKELINEQFPVQDQDIINSACYNHISLLHPKYNLMLTQEIERCDMNKVYGLQLTNEAFTNPVIIHYAGCIKPWKNPSIEYSNEWWNIGIGINGWTDIWLGMSENVKKEISFSQKSIEYQIGSLITAIPKWVLKTVTSLKYVGLKGVLTRIKKWF